jgi:hypothetical protein
MAAKIGTITMAGMTQAAYRAPVVFSVRWIGPTAASCRLAVSATER